MLISRGAYVSSYTDDEDEPHWCRYSPLRVASSRFEGCFEVGKLLIDHGADPSHLHLYKHTCCYNNELVNRLIDYSKRVKYRFLLLKWRRALNMLRYGH